MDRTIRKKSTVTKATSSRSSAMPWRSAQFFLFSLHKNKAVCLVQEYVALRRSYCYTAGFVIFTTVYLLTLYFAVSLNTTNPPASAFLKPSGNRDRVDTALKCAAVCAKRLSLDPRCTQLFTTTIRCSPISHRLSSCPFGKIPSAATTNANGLGNSRPSVASVVGQIAEKRRIPLGS